MNLCDKSCWSNYPYRVTSVAKKKTSSGASTQLIICFLPPIRVIVATFGLPFETPIPPLGIPEIPYNSWDFALKSPVGANCLLFEDGPVQEEKVISFCDSLENSVKRNLQSTPFVWFWSSTLFFVRDEELLGLIPHTFLLWLWLLLEEDKDSSTSMASTAGGRHRGRIHFPSVVTKQLVRQLTTLHVKHTLSFRRRRECQSLWLRQFIFGKSNQPFRAFLFRSSKSMSNCNHSSSLDSLDLRKFRRTRGKTCRT